MEVLTIALTKGRLEKSAIALFEQAGIDCSSMKDKKRKLIFESADGKYRFMLVKAVDVITYVRHGVADIGIVGKDVLIENSGGYLEMLDLMIGKCKFALASTKNFEAHDYRRKVIASKYPTVTSNYFAEKGEDVEIIKIEGSVEVAPILGLADAIVDIVETGSTLKENGLEVYEDICQISGRLIVNNAALKRKRDEIFEVIEQVEAVI